jgi:hypothetical protein
MPKALILLTAVAALTACGTELPAQELQRADYGDDWPLTVDSGTVRCEHGTQVVFESGGKTYAVNGAATSQRPDLPDVAEIWADNPAGQPPKLDISPIVDAGLELCE